ncbi:unnamed protein product [Cuscuta campestris]|uniref:CCHC-type domain-containing protein n=1 Tax=Cuscuta campestris TaxID=132261 RepID=A0A484L4U1_9ASTE|nr:unnamed protein product [Cuscuta campestris]
MFERFSKIVNDLHALKKTYTDKELVRKILWSLTPEWRSKVDAIQESISITNVTIDGLRGNLKTYESTILFPSLGEQKKKGIALKASTSQEPVVEESSDEDNEFGLVVKKFHKFMCKEYERKSKRHGGPPKCYWCGEVRHIKPKCPNAKNEKEKKSFKKHRAYISWGADSGDESSEGEENESANLCLMAHKEPPEEELELDCISCVLGLALDSLENIYLNDNDEGDNSKESQDEEVEPLVNEEQPQEEETPMPRAWRTSKNHPLDKVIGDINRKPRKFNHTALSQEDTKTLHAMIHNANINWRKFVMTHMFNATSDNRPLPYALLVMTILDEFHINTDVGPKCKGTKHWEIDDSSFHSGSDETPFRQPRPCRQPRATVSTNPSLAEQMAALTATLSRIDTNISQTAKNINILSPELH